jgi:uncharacterized protein YicC (UPF0701 family)
VVRSMTGYGAAEVEAQTGRWWVEVRSTNHRFLEVVVRLPRDLGALEDRVRAAVAGRVRRGRVEVLVREEATGRARSVTVDTELARQYAQALETLRRELGIQDSLNLAALLALAGGGAAGGGAARRGAGVASPSERGWTRPWTAWYGCGKRRARTWRRTWRPGWRAWRSGWRKCPVAPRSCPGCTRSASGNGWRSWVRALGVERPPDEARLAMEVAAFADRCDVREELVRLRSHLHQARALLHASDGAVGRKLEFLLQEMQREVNTVGSKAGDLDVTRAVLEMKSELEAIREQVQNVE